MQRKPKAKLARELRTFGCVHCVNVAASRARCRQYATAHFINIGIVDARSGEVLAYTQTATPFDIGKEDDKRLVDVITRSLKKLPSGTPPEKN